MERCEFQKILGQEMIKTTQIFLEECTEKAIPYITCSYDIRKNNNYYNNYNNNWI